MFVKGMRELQEKKRLIWQTEKYLFLWHKFARVK